MSFKNEFATHSNSNLESEQNHLDIDSIRREDIEDISDPEELKRMLLATLQKAEELQSRIDTLESTSHIEKSIIAKKQERLSEIRFGLTETNERMERPYLISSGLANAKKALEILATKGQMNSIILEGEPGTGKTQWAYSEVGQELRKGKDSMLIHVRVKDTMRSQDLLYTVDNIQRLSDAQTAQIPEVIREEATEWKRKILSGEVDPSSDDGYKRFSSRLGAIKELGESAKDLNYINYVQLGPLGEAIVQSAKGKKVWLLIDEIEKGREELMTGMLDEIENLTFTITETGHTVKGRKENMRIVITTNTEESDKIPASFRRRSLYHYIDYPTRDEMAEIVRLNYPNLHETLLSYALDTFYSLHNDENMQKKPSTPELLSWIQLLQAEFPYGIYDGVLDERIPHQETLIKYNDDNEHLREREQTEKNADVVWESMTPMEKNEYFVEKDDYDDEFRHISQYDDAVRRISSTTGLSAQSVVEAMLYLRRDSSRIDTWASGENNNNQNEDDQGSGYDDNDDYDDYDDYNEDNY